MFDALKGLKEALAAKERPVTPKKELPEQRIAELSQQLAQLQLGQVVTVVYYGEYEQQYLQLTGIVTRVDGYWQRLTIGETAVDFAEIYDIFV